MATVALTVRIDEDAKKGLMALCDELGLSISSAINMFAKQAVREHALPLDLSLDPFYAQSHQEHLKKSYLQLRRGEGTVHKLIETDE